MFAFAKGEKLDLHVAQVANCYSRKLKRLLLDLNAQ
jgi:hypothetical protein